MLLFLGYYAVKGFSMKSIIYVGAIFLFFSLNVLAAANDYIRVNQVGYITNDTKIAIIGSGNSLSGTFYLVDAANTNIAYFSNTIGSSRGNNNTPFANNYPCDFSAYTTPGQYRIKMNDGTISHPFAIGAYSEYSNTVAAILDFFRSQRCGDTSPILHTACHLHDTNGTFDYSGGWHDAGDYIKFVITTSFTTLDMMIAAEYALSNGYAHALEDNREAVGVPDLLEEGRIGLEWLLKMTGSGYYYQVSVRQDHDTWRLPQADDAHPPAGVGDPRPVHSGWGGNLLGRTAGAFAIAYRIYQPYDPSFSAQCLTRAQSLFSNVNSYQYAQDSIPTNFYNETSYEDDLVIAAAELYMSTGDSTYSSYASSTIGGLWEDGIEWGSCDFIAYAECYRAGINATACRNDMRNALNSIRTHSQNEVYYLSSSYTWGTTAAYMANAQKAIMYYCLTGNDAYMDMANAQRDYLLGRNNWGVSFIVDVGEEAPTNSHSQLNDILAPVLHRGACVGGPARVNHWESTMTNDGVNIASIRAVDRFSNFQSSIVYYDHKEDYYCNEVAIDYATTPLFVMIYNLGQASFSQPVSPPPLVTITLPTNNQIIKKDLPFTIEAHVTDDGTITAVEYQISPATTWSTMSNVSGALYRAAGIDIFSFLNGNHTITVRAIDNNNAIGTYTIPVVFIVTGQPYVRITGPTNGSIFSDSEEVSLVAMATDAIAVSNVEYTVDGAAYITFYSNRISGDIHSGIYTAAIGTLSQGTHSLAVRVTDNHGLTNKHTISISVVRQPTFGYTDFETYESYSDTANLRTVWTTYSGTGGESIDVYLAATSGTGGDKGLRADYNLSGGGYAGTERAVNDDWTGYSGIRFWIRTDVATRDFNAVISVDAGGYTDVPYLTSFTDVGPSFEENVVYFSNLTPSTIPTWWVDDHSNARPTFDIHHIKLVTVEPISQYDRIFYLDDFQLIGGPTNYIPTVDSISPSGTLSQTILIDALCSDSNGNNTISRAQFRFGTSGTWLPLLGANAHWTNYYNTALLPDGATTLFVRCRDDKFAWATNSIAVIIDNSGIDLPPVISITAPTPGMHRATISISADITDDTAVLGAEYQIDSGAWATLTHTTGSTYAVSWNTHTVSDGVHTVFIRAWDSVISNTVTNSRSFSVDNTPPIINSAATLPAIMRCYTNTITSSVTDAVSIAYCHYRIDTNQWQSLNALGGTLYRATSIDVTGYTNGTHALEIRAVDGASNISLFTQGIAISNPPPFFSLLTMPTGTVTGTNSPIQATVQQSCFAIQLVEYQCDGTGGPWIPLAYSGTSNLYTNSFDTTMYTNGAHTIYLRVQEDTHSPLTNAYSFNISNDISAPIIVINSPTGIVAGTNVSISADVTDESTVSSVEYQIDTAAWQILPHASGDRYSTIWNTTNLADGPHQLNIRAWDNHYNYATNTRIVFVTNAINTAPSISITPTNGTLLAVADIILRVIINDNSSITEAQFRIDSGTWTNLNGTQPFYSNTIIGLTDGFHHIEVRAVDDGIPLSVMSNHTSVTLLIDTTSPAITINNPAAGSIVSNTLNAFITITDETNIIAAEYSIDTTAWTALTHIALSNYSALWQSTNAANGMHYFVVRAIDTFNNTNVISNLFYISNYSYADTNAPAITINNPAAGSIISNTLNAFITITDETNIIAAEYSIDTTAWTALTHIALSNYSALWQSTNTANGMHYFVVRTIDALNNTNIISNLFYISNMTYPSPPVSPVFNLQKNCDTILDTVLYDDEPLWLCLKHRGDYTISIYSLDGRKILSVIKSGPNSINLTESYPELKTLNSGVYLFLLQYEDQPPEPVIKFIRQ